MNGYRLGLMHGALLVAIVLVGFVAFCQAQTWIVGSGAALHLNGDPHCNSFTAGIGFERHVSRDWRAAFGVYDNSNCRTSAYGSAVWTPLHAGRWHLGAIGGFVTGYRMPVSPAAGLSTSYEAKRWGVNLIFIPPLKNSGNVLWLQAKVPW